MIVVASVVVFLLLFLHYTGLLKPIENLFVRASAPIYSTIYKSSSWVGNVYLNLKEKQELIKENKDLKDQLAILINEKSQFLVEQEENVFLREQLEYTQSNDFSFQVAEVVGRNSDNTQNAIIINVGSKRGVEVGQAVIAEQNMMIGKVDKVLKNSSVVLLINDDLSKVASRIQNGSKTIGIVEGEFGLGIKIRLIPQTEMIKEGDVVVTSGLEKNIPANIVIGQIKSIFNEPEELFQEATVESMVDFNKIHMVNVLMPKSQDD